MLEKLAIFDSFHDFGKGGNRVLTSPNVTFNSIHSLIFSPSLYGEKYTNLEKAINNQASIKLGEDAIEKEILVGLPTDVSTIVKRYNYALMYDFGKVPDDLKNRQGGSIHRVINSASARPGPIFKQL